MSETDQGQERIASVSSLADRRRQQAQQPAGPVPAARVHAWAAELRRIVRAHRPDDRDAHIYPHTPPQGRTDGTAAPTRGIDPETGGQTGTAAHSGPDGAVG